MILIQLYRFLLNVTHEITFFLMLIFFLCFSKLTGRYPICHKWVHTPLMKSFWNFKSRFKKFTSQIFLMYTDMRVYGGSSSLSAAESHNSSNISKRVFKASSQHHLCFFCLLRCCHFVEFYFFILLNYSWFKMLC